MFYNMTGLYYTVLIEQIKTTLIKKGNHGLYFIHPYVDFLFHNTKYLYYI